MKAQLYYDYDENLDGIYILGHRLIFGEKLNADLIDILVRQHMQTPLSNCPLTPAQCAFYAKTILEQATKEEIFARGQIIVMREANGISYKKPFYFNLFNDDPPPPEFEQTDEISMPECLATDKHATPITRLEFDDELVSELTEKLGR